MTTMEQLKPKLNSIQNPFESQLPETEPEDEEPMDKPEITEPATSAPIFNIPVTEEPLPPIPTFEITGIIWDSDRPQAIINEQIVDIGDTIEDVRITEIEKTAIRGTFHGASITIKP